jgi:hypothetical protein
VTAPIPNAVLGGQIPDGLTVEEAVLRADAASKLFLETLNSLTAVLVAANRMSDAQRAAAIASVQCRNDEDLAQGLAKLVTPNATYQLRRDFYLFACSLDQAGQFGSNLSAKLSPPFWEVHPLSKDLDRVIDVLSNLSGWAWQAPSSEPAVGSEVSP